MTYQQSLENIKTLMNLIRIFDQDSIFFKFSNDSEFTILFYDEKTELHQIQNLSMKNQRENLPVATISLEKHEHEHFFYFDVNISYEFDLTASKVILNNSNQKFLPQHPAQIKLQMAKLLAQLKKL